MHAEYKYDVTMKKKLLTLTAMLLTVHALMAETKTVGSPDGQLQVTITDDGGRAAYSIAMNGVQVLLPSALGFEADLGDFTQGLTITGANTQKIDRTYQMRQTKQSTAQYVANRLDVNFRNAEGLTMTVVFQVSNNNVAFRYAIPRPVKDHPKAVIVELGAGLSCLRRQLKNETNLWINIDFPDVIVCREKYIPVGRLEMTISKRPAIMMRSCISALITAGAWPQNAA